MNQTPQTPVAQKAIEYVPLNTIIGVGTGSTADLFIDELALTSSDNIIGAIASSNAPSNASMYCISMMSMVESVPVYIDGADEIDPEGNMIKGGGGRAIHARNLRIHREQFICIADASKEVNFGQIPPVEVTALASAVFRCPPTK